MGVKWYIARAIRLEQPNNGGKMAHCMSYLLKGPVMGVKWYIARAIRLERPNNGSKMAHCMSYL